MGALLNLVVFGILQYFVLFKTQAYLRKFTESRDAVTHGSLAKDLADIPAHTSIQLRTFGSMKKLSVIVLSNNAVVDLVHQEASI